MGRTATWRWRLPISAVVLALCAMAIGCTSSPDSSSTRAGPPTADGSGTRATSSGEGTNESSFDEPQDGCGPTEEVSEDASFVSVDLEEIGGNEDVVVSAAIYPLPDTEGNPWSQWGQGVVLPDGRFVSAVGDHLGRDGTSWIYEYDPSTNELTRTVEVSTGLGHVQGDWGYGKVHAPMVLSGCGDVIGATYWGTRTDLEFGGSYQGDQLFRYDPFKREITSLGVPVEGFGIPSIAISPDRKWIFGEAVDSRSDTGADTGGFFVADAETGEVTFYEANPSHVGFRSIMVTAGGDARYSLGDKSLMAVDPIDGSEAAFEGVLPGEWLRASAPIGPDGSTYGATREPDALFRLSADGEFSDLGGLPDYVASLALSPDGSTLYYVPGAHGNGYINGTPLIARDVATGDERELVRLNDLIEPALGVRAGGTYNVVADSSGERIYVGLNSGPIDDNEATFGDVVLAVVDLR